MKSLEKLRNEIKVNNKLDDDVKKTDENRKTQNKMNILHQSIPVLSNFEKELEIFKEEFEEVKNATNVLNENLKDIDIEIKDKFSSAVKKLNIENAKIEKELENLINEQNNLFDPLKHNKDYVQSLNNKIELLKKEMAINLASAKLEKESLILNQSVVDNNEFGGVINQEPYSLLKNDFDSLNKAKKDVLDNFEKTKSEIEVLREKNKEINEQLQKLWTENVSLLEDDKKELNLEEIQKLEEESKKINNELQEKLAESKESIEKQFGNFEKLQVLAKKVNEAAKALKNINATDYPELSKNLKEIIEANRMFSSDDLGEINKKLKIIDDSIAKIDSSKQAKNKLNELIKVKQNQYKEENNFEQRKIFKEVDEEIQGVIDQQLAIISNPESTLSQLNVSAAIIEQAISKYTLAKDFINKEFEAAKDDFNTKSQEFLSDEKANKFYGINDDNLSEGTEIQKLIDKYNKLIKDDQTTLMQINNLKDNLELAYNKDKFNNKQNSILNKLNSVKEKFLQIPDLMKNNNSENPLDKITELVHLLKADINSKTKLSEVSQIIGQFEKLNSIEDLLEKQEEIADKIIENKLNNNSKETLVNILKKSTFSNIEPTLSTPTNSEIFKMYEQISEEYNNSREFADIVQSSNEKIKLVKEKVKDKLSNDLIDQDANGKIQALLDKFESELNLVKLNPSDLNGSKNEVIKYENKANNIDNKLDDIFEFAKVIKKADELSKEIGSTSGNDALNSFKEKLDQIVLNAKEKYTDFQSYDDIKNQIKEVTALIQASQKVESQFNELNELFKTIEYKQGLNEQDQSQTKKEQLQGFINKLKDFSSSDEVKNNISNVNLLGSVIISTKSLIETHKKILDKYNLTEFNFQNEKYGYEWDQKNIAESTLSTVPNIPGEKFEPINLTTELKKLKEAAEEKALKANILYNLRKAEFEKADKYFKEDVAKIEAKVLDKAFEELKNDQLIFYKDILNKIKLVDSYEKKSEIDIHSQNIELAHSMTDNFIELANAVKRIKDKKQNINAKNIVENNSELKEAIDKIDQMVESIEKQGKTKWNENIYFYNLKASEINNEINKIEVHNAKLDLLLKHLEAKNKLEESILKDKNARKILDAILKDFSLSIKLLDTADKIRIKDLETQYIDGGLLSFNKVFESSKQLLTVIEEAKKIKVESSDEYYIKETLLMKKLYDELNIKINEAVRLLDTEELYKDNRLISDRSKLINDINNPSYGIIAKIKFEKKREKDSIIKELEAIDNYISSNYEENNSPKLDDFNTLEIRNKKDTEFNTLEEIKNITTEINATKVKIQEQKKSIFDFNKNRLEIMKNQFEKYVKLLSGEEFNTSTDLKQISKNDSQTLVKYIGIEALINIYKDHINEVQEFLDSSNFNENSYIQDSRLINDKYKLIENDYKELKSKSKTAFSLIKNSIEVFNNEVKIKQESDSKSTLFDLIKKIYIINNSNKTDIENSELFTRLKDVDEKTKNLPQDLEKITPAEYFENNYNDSKISEVQTNVDNEFKEYYEVINKILEGLASIDTLIKGKNKDTNDLDSLQGIYTHFVENRTISNFLNLVSSDQYRSDDVIKNEPFRTLISAYKPLQDSLKLDSKSSADKILNDLTSLLDLKLKVLKGVFEPSVHLLEWFNKSENQQLVLSYLISNEQKNMKDIVPNHKTLYEEFKKAIDKKIQSNSSTKEIEITENDDILKLFKRFIFLKNNIMPFNLNNIKVYLTRENTSDDFAPEFVQADTSIKKTKLNFKVVYNKTTDNSFFGDVEKFELKFNDIWVTFNTLTTFNTKLEHVYSPNQKPEDYWKTKTIFIGNEAGWNNKTFSSHFLNAFSAAADFKSEKQISLFREDITFDDENWDKSLNSELKQPENNFYAWNNKELFEQSKMQENSLVDFSTSSKNFKYKIKLKDETFVVNNKKYKLAKFGQKQFMYWDQADTDMKNISNSQISMWIPYFIYIPLISEDGKDFTVLHISYQENFQVPWAGNNYEYKFSFVPKSSVDNGRWYIMNKNRLDFNILNEVNKNSAEFTNLSEKELNEVKANLLAQEMAKHYTDKQYLGKLRNKYFYDNSLKTNNSFWQQVGKFNIFVRIREENKEVE
ncbi:hypothetical protein [Metamycoplasma canadense]|uniref:hypothetical protein n=1 Tax=Metamycoplasma canadense TaxID=29554 RepID=UPI0005EDDD59|nr:hypothetical protein [Metamycoplasma canadense]